MHGHMNVKKQPALFCTLIICLENIRYEKYVKVSVRRVNNVNIIHKVSTSINTCSIVCIVYES